MALERLVIDGYGQLELNNAAFRRSGRIEAQCKIAAAIDYVENGMLLAVDNVNREVKYPDGKLPVALNYSSEHMYDDRANGLKNFKLEKNTYLPRLGYLGAGDKYTTNCIAYETTEFATETALKEAIAAVKTAPLYAKTCANGAHQITKESEGAVALVVCESTMPDGQYAVKFQAI